MLQLQHKRHPPTACVKCNHVGRPNIELNTALLLGEYQWGAYGDDLPQERRFGRECAIAVYIVRVAVVVIVVAIAAGQ